MSSIEINNNINLYPPFATDEEALVYRINLLTFNLIYRNTKLCKNEYDISKLLAYSGFIKNTIEGYYTFSNKAHDLKRDSRELLENYYEYRNSLFEINDKKKLQELDRKLVETIDFIGGNSKVPSVEMLTRDNSESIIRFRECLRQEALKISNQNRDKLVVAKEKIESKIELPKNITEEELEEKFSIIKEMIHSNDGYKSLDKISAYFKALVTTFAEAVFTMEERDRFTEIYNDVKNKLVEIGDTINKTVSEKAIEIYDELALDEVYIDKFIKYNNQNKLVAIYNVGIDKMNETEQQIINDELPLYNIEYLTDIAKEIEGINYENDSDYSKEVLAWLKAEKAEDLEDKEEIIRNGMDYKMYFIEANALEKLGVNDMTVDQLIEDKVVLEYLADFLNIDTDDKINLTVETLEDWVKRQAKLGENDNIYNVNDPLSIIDPEWNHQGESRGIVGQLFDVVHYRFDPDQKIFYTTTEAVQKYLGYYNMYDEMCSIGPLFRIDYLLVPNVLDSNGVPWNIRAWKGNYWGAAGGEIGAYCGTGQFDYHETLLEDEEQANGIRSDNMLVMGFTLKDGDEKLFTRYPEPNWWVIGMKPLQNKGFEDKRANDKLKIDGYTLEGTINFLKDNIFAENFRTGLVNIGKNLKIHGKSGNVVKFTWVGE